MKKCIMLLIVVIFLSGCVSSAPYWARRLVVHNDWVLVKSNKTLYRRYTPNGVLLGGNKDLLKEEKSITAGNKGIKVYGSYLEAKKDLGENLKIHESSKKFALEEDRVEIEAEAEAKIEKSTEEITKKEE